MTKIVFGVGNFGSGPWPPQSSSSEGATGFSAAGTQDALLLSSKGELDLTHTLLANEERTEREEDTVYWNSLRRELELMRRTRRG